MFPVIVLLSLFPNNLIASDSTGFVPPVNAPISAPTILPVTEQLEESSNEIPYLQFIIVDEETLQILEFFILIPSSLETLFKDTPNT